MLTITDAASETMIRLDMTNPFLRLVTKLSLGTRSAGSAHRCSNLRLKVQRDSTYDRNLRVRGRAPADGLNVHRALKVLRRRGESARNRNPCDSGFKSGPAAEARTSGSVDSCSGHRGTGLQSPRSHTAPTDLKPAASARVFFLSLRGSARSRFACPCFWGVAERP
jgi:hypothetical protein